MSASEARARIVEEHQIRFGFNLRLGATVMYCENPSCELGKDGEVYFVIPNDCTIEYLMEVASAHRGKFS